MKHEEEDVDIEKLKTVRFEFARGAFRAKSMHCGRCGGKTARKSIEMALPDGFLTVKADVFKCRKCGKEYLSFDEARKLDRALVVARALGRDSYKIRKSLSFDGDNYVFRIPAGVAKNLGKHPHVDMIPLSSKEMLIQLG